MPEPITLNCNKRQIQRKQKENLNNYLSEWNFIKGQNDDKIIFGQRLCAKEGIVYACWGGYIDGVCADGVSDIPGHYFSDSDDAVLAHFESEKQKALSHNYKFRSPTIDDSVLKYHDQVVFLVPFKRHYDMFYLRNLYSDLNVFTVCENDNFDEGCDIVSSKKHENENYAANMYSGFDALCDANNPFKVYVKMDYDTFIKKRPVFDALKPLLDSPETKFLLTPKKYAVGDKETSDGKFYAFSHGLMAEYCRCKPAPPAAHFEKSHFSTVMAKCLAATKTPEMAAVPEFTRLVLDDNIVYFKNFTTDGVELIIIQ
ncbi:hypothetical protein AYI69_g2554 [Smittium culicis]|uniref:Hexosyltransferase n=1 Tax=Smittium culicis TaxID=133412 RepID=A0A1R1YM61_9FUNG|nr:hypothetical protein AYI69_g2554 [Smittium culicis]